MKRFVRLYPDYNGRSLAITLVSGHDPRKSNSWVRNFTKNYGIGNVTFVKSVSDGGLSATSYCNGNESGCEIQSRKIAFDDWTTEEQRLFGESYNEFILLLNRSLDEAQEKWPIFFELFRDRFRELHNRKIFYNNPVKIACGCLPGPIRLFCNVHGEFYPCERVEQTDTVRIGDVWRGYDMKKIESMINVFSEKVNCNNCIAKYICSICPVAIKESKNTGLLDEEFLNAECQVSTQRLKKQIVNYVSLFEENPKLFDKIFSLETNRSEEDWLQDVQFVLENHHLCTNCQIINHE